MNFAEIIVVGMAALALSFFAVAAIAGPNANADDPRIVMRRCRLVLREVRRELEQIPAGRDTHDVFAQLESTERAIDKTEAVLSRGNK